MKLRYNTMNRKNINIIKVVENDDVGMMKK